MQVWSSERVRGAALVGIVGAVGTALAGVVIQAVVQPATTVPDDRWSYPWSSEALVPVSLVFALLHALVFAGVLGFARSGIAGPSRGARAGLALALAGTALFVMAEPASIPFRDQQLDDTGPAFVGGLYGLATLLSAVGFISAGIATIRAGAWADWRRLTPLAVGIWMAAMLALALTKALPTGVAVWGLSLLAFCGALYTRPAGVDTTRMLPAAGGQAA
jgi:hypothetical protein